MKLCWEKIAFLGLKLPHTVIFANAQTIPVINPKKNKKITHIFVGVWLTAAHIAKHINLTTSFYSPVYGFESIFTDDWKMNEFFNSDFPISFTGKMSKD